MPARRHMRALNPEIYTRLFRESLPNPPATEADNKRLIGILEGIDEREQLAPEEEAFFELLGIVIEDCENKHYSPPSVLPHEALQALMEDRGLQHKDVAEAAGNKGLTSEIV